jgi:hypothetical protein
MYIVHLRPARCVAIPQAVAKALHNERFPVISAGGWLFIYLSQNSTILESVPMWFYLGWHGAYSPVQLPYWCICALQQLCAPLSSCGVLPSIPQYDRRPSTGSPSFCLPPPSKTVLVRGSICELPGTKDTERQGLRKLTKEQLRSTPEIPIPSTKKKV